MRILLATIFVFFPLSQSFSAPIVINHDDAARRCYLATLGPLPMPIYEEGVAACDRAITAANDDAQMRAALFVNRADIHLLMQDYKGTVADARASIALEPDLSVAYLNWGAGLIGLHQYRDAVGALEKAITLGSTDKLQLAYFNSAIAHEQLGDVAGAYVAYKKAVEIDPNFTAAKEQLSRFTVVTKPKP